MKIFLALILGGVVIFLLMLTYRLAWTAVRSKRVVLLLFIYLLFINDVFRG